jgi:hypothetical protein
MAIEVQTAKHFYTPEEYLELEEQAEFKSEYRDGEGDLYEKVNFAENEDEN